jgi:hypothetical protein
MDPETKTQQQTSQNDVHPGRQPSLAQKIIGRSRHQQSYDKLNYKQAVLATLAYFDIFQYPLTVDETTKFLYKLEPDQHHVEMTLNESKLITRRGSYYQLKGEQDHISTRHDRDIIAKGLWKRIDRFRWIFNITPYLRMAAICNNLSTNNTSNTSDIDLLIITKPGRLFISRLILTFWLHIFGVRRHGDKVSGRFCLSFFATEGTLQCEYIEKKPYDLYLAYWLQTLEPIAGSRLTYEKILDDNEEWAKKFFKRRLLYNMHHFKESPKWAVLIKGWQEKLWDTKWGQKLENKLTEWQLKRAKEKRSQLNLEETDVIIDQDILKFHNIDKRNEIYEEWSGKLTAILKHY